MDVSFTSFIVPNIVTAHNLNLGKEKDQMYDFDAITEFVSTILVVIQLKCIPLKYTHLWRQFFMGSSSKDVGV